MRPKRLSTDPHYFGQIEKIVNIKAQNWYKHHIITCIPGWFIKSFSPICFQLIPTCVNSAGDTLT